MGDKLPNVMKLRAIEWWQEEGKFHPLTCGIDSNHGLLRGRETMYGDMYLECPDCGYVQGFIPSTVYDMYLRVGVGLSFLAQ